VQPLAILALCLSASVVYPLLAATAGSGATGSAAAPDGVQRHWLLFVRDHKAWAVTADGGETKGPLAMGELVSGVNPSPDGRYLASVTGPNHELRVFRLLPDFEVAKMDGPRPGLLQVTGWAWSPDGQHLAITEDEGGLRVLRVQPDPGVAEVQALRPGLVSVQACWWSPNGRYLTIRTEGRRSRQTLGGEHIPAPTANADDDRLGTQGQTGIDWAVHIVSWRAGEEASPGLPLVLPPLLSVPSGSVHWSPKSDAVAYPRPTGNPNVCSDAILVTDVPSGHTREILAAEQSFFVDLCWSADGRSFTWGSHDGIRSIPADGSGRESVLVEGKGDWFASPRWSPDGAFVVYARSWGANGSGAPLMALCVLDTRSGRNTRITADGVSVDWHGYYAWSPAGTLVSFNAYFPGPDRQPGEYAVCVADPATGGVTRVVGGLPSRPLPAVWLPAGAPPGEDD